MLKRGYRIYEVPISYNGREFDEGKKLNPVREGPKALYYLKGWVDVNELHLAS